MNQLIFWIAIVMVLFTLTIIQIYGLHIFKSMQNLLIIERRYPILVITEGIIVLIWLLLVAPLWSNDLLQATYFGNESAKYFLFSIAAYISPTVTHLIVCIEASRLWLMSFDLHYLHGSENEHWKSQIDESFAQKHWYLKNKNRYGNQKYILLITMCYYIFIVTTVTILYVYEKQIAWYMDGFCYLIVVSFVVCLYYNCRKYKKLNDNFLFFYEFRITAIIWSVCIVIFFVSVFLLMFVTDWIGFMLFILNGIVAGTVPSLLSTVWITKKIAKMDIWNDCSSYDKSLTDNKSVDMEMDEQTKINQNDFDVYLFETLKCEEKFELFVHWMYREFSSESLLCFISLVQFKEHIIDWIQSDKNDSDYKYLNIFYDNIPPCTIVYGNDLTETVNNIQTFRNTAHELYEKYIKYDAGWLRTKYARFDKMNWSMGTNELINVFDPIIHEMFLFMRNSFIRSRVNN